MKNIAIDEYLMIDDEWCFCFYILKTTDKNLGENIQV